MRMSDTHSRTNPNAASDPAASGGAFKDAAAFNGSEAVAE
jgi:hypothetical protein